jgi:hypothetical protein
VKVSWRPTQLAAFVIALAVAFPHAPERDSRKANSPKNFRAMPEAAKKDFYRLKALRQPQATQ